MHIITGRVNYSLTAPVLDGQSDLIDHDHTARGMNMLHRILTVTNMTGLHGYKVNPRKSNTWWMRTTGVVE